MFFHFVRLVYYWVCENILLIRLFKTYWPVQGSYWNSSHIDKNEIKDLETVICQSWNYTQQHLPPFLIILIMFVFSLFEDNTLSWLQIICFRVSIFWELYALNVHVYNREKAKDRIQLLRNCPEEENKALIQEKIKQMESALVPKNIYFNFIKYQTISDFNKLLLLKSLLEEQEEEERKSNFDQTFLGTHLWLEIHKSYTFEVWSLQNRISKKQIGPYFSSCEALLAYRKKYRNECETTNFFNNY